MDNKEINYSLAKTKDTGSEKHVPVISSSGRGILTVQVGSLLHPMEESHYIQWIEVHTDLDIYRAELLPGDLPRAQFQLANDENVMAVYEYCSVHGLWGKEMPRAVHGSSCAGDPISWPHSDR